MVFVIIAIALALVIIGAVLSRRKNDKRGVSYAPDLSASAVRRSSSGAPSGPGVLPQVAIPTEEVQTESIAHNEFASDVTDDLLDPRNPNHAQWVKDHPGMETDAEWEADHPEETPS
jgi:hypothetical protein